ncbi:MAG TPA: Gfo/Idh/MocA family oxidoreductase [Armatimonadota bacterium]|nr:Gfo/Idh/MocA family oxidoreductase [Armatimonadota bacterium]
MSGSISRRRFVQASAAVAGTLAMGSCIQGANDRVRLGFIGVANRGSQLLEATLVHKDAQVVAVCDCYKPARDRWVEKLEGDVTSHSDFREILDRDDIDAVVIGTPDHWHAIQTIMACDAGKDVYVEKPLSITIKEGRSMVAAARRNGAVVQVGTQRRSSTLLPQLREYVESGNIGHVSVATCYRISNMYPSGIGVADDQEPPEGLDWDMWLGPRPDRPFNPTIQPYKFRWHGEFSSQVANWGVHYFDAIRWLLDEEAPVSVCAMGGQYAVNDMRDIPDTMQATFEFASGRLMTFGQYEASGNRAIENDLELRGTLGTVAAGEQRFTVTPELAGQFGKPAPLAPEKVVESSDGDLTVAHIRNFLDCVKSREKPNADIEIGHRSTTFSLLANISLATRSRIEWDPVKERITSPESANKLLHYKYRSPWKLG